MKRSTRTLLAMWLTLPLTFASAAQVYRWVDDSGVTHFSETPPPENAADTQVINIAPTPTPASDRANAEDDDFYSVVNQAKRMEARRLESERLAAEKEQARAEASRARAEAAAIQQGPSIDSADNNVRYYPVYPYYPRYGHHPWKPGHRPKPERPVHPVEPQSRIPRTSLGKTPGMPGQSGSWR
ncbi:MAG: DUF4124 domain-containing protein [Gammaproteobacteria bacterium]|jgi:hypothetical protein|nr:DUF4124 domain-containing protein [Gammaproteobacteria bacterium]